MEERRPHAEHYWTASDPTAVHGPGAESLVAFVDRVRALIERLSSMDEERVIVVTHGQVMQAMIYLLDGRASPSNADEMRAYRAYTTAISMPNTAVLALERREGQRFASGAISTAHLDVVTF